MKGHSTKKDGGKLQPVALEPGLYIVATPIGNLRDMTLRALDVLQGVDLIACEDTRVSGKLLKAYDIKKPLESYNDHSAKGQRGKLLEKLAQGGSIALISDAGMPLISDPGYKLVRDCLDLGINVTSLPGANAPLTALQLSGLPSDKFCFLGFLPAKEVARRKVLQEWQSAQASLIVFETGPRLLAALKDIEVVLGNREVAVIRELTKMYEQVKRARVLELIEYYEEAGQPKGEIVVVIAPPEQKALSEEEIKNRLKEALDIMSTKEAASQVAEETGLSKKVLYEMALEIGRDEQ